MKNDTSRRAERLRKLKVGGMARLITIAVVAIIILLNVVAAMIFEVYPIKLDMTGTGFYGLSEATEEFLKSVDSEIEITLLSDKETFSANGSYYNQVVECMELYADRNPLIKINYVDLVENPAFTSNYPDRDLQGGMILVESKKTGRNIALDDTDYFNMELDNTSYSYTITSAKTEEALTSAIINTTDEDPKVIGVLSGHGEGDVSGLCDLLDKNGYTIEKNVTLYSGELAGDYDGLIIATPTNDYTDEELVILEDYMENDGAYGKNIFYFASPEQATTPNLAAYLAEWGIGFYDGTAYETDSDKLLSVYPYISKLSYADTSFTEGLESSSVALTAPFSKPIKVLYETDGDFQTQTLAGFTSTAVVMPNDADANKWKPEDATEKGPFGAVVLSKYMLYDYIPEGQLKEYSSNVYAFSSTYFQSSSILQSTVYANGEYLLGMFDERFNRQASVSLVPKYVSSRSMNMTQAQATGILIVFAVVLPLGIIAAGIFVWLRRRHA